MIHLESPETTNAARRTRGFTLIEVLAALVIVGLGMLGVIQAVIQSANQGTYLREKTLAHWIAMNLVTERRLMTSPPKVGTSSDIIEFAGQRWRWSVKVSATTVESMHRFDVSVGFADAPESEKLASAIGFYGTAIAPAGSSNVPWDRGSAPAPNPGGDGKQVDGENNPPPGAGPDPNDDADAEQDEPSGNQER